MTEYKQIRKKAAGLLHENFPCSLVAVLFVLLLCCTEACISSLFWFFTDRPWLMALFITVFRLLFLYFFTLPACLGTVRLFWRMCLGAKDSVASVLYYFYPQQYLQARPMVRFAFLLLLPNMLLQGFVYGTSYLILAILFQILAFFGYLFAAARLIAVAGFFCMEDRPLREAIQLEHRLLEHQGFQRFLHSYFPWLLLCLAILPIGYVLPFWILGILCFLQIHLERQNQAAEAAQRKAQLLEHFAIRQITAEEDLLPVAKLAEAIWRQHFTPILPAGQVDYMLEHFQSYEAMCRQVREEGYLYHTMEFDGQMVGYFAIKKDGSRLFLSKLYLEQSWRGKGFASLALNYMKEFCRANNLTSIWLTVNRFNTDTIAVYHHFGFQVFRTYAADIGGGYVMDDYYMELPLA